MHFYKDFTCVKLNRHHDFKWAVQKFLSKNQKDGRAWSVQYIDKGCHKWEQFLSSCSCLIRIVSSPASNNLSFHKLFEHWFCVCSLCDPTKMPLPLKTNVDIGNISVIVVFRPFCYGVLPAPCWEGFSHLVQNSLSHYWTAMSLCRKPHRLIMGRDPSALSEKSVAAPLTWAEKAIRGQGFSSSVVRHAGMFCLLVTARSLRFNSAWEGRVSASVPLCKHCGSFLVLQGKLPWSYSSSACLSCLPNNLSPPKPVASGTQTSGSFLISKAICFLLVPSKKRHLRQPVKDLHRWNWRFNLD